jgi:hypothetical protein
MLFCIQETLSRFGSEYGGDTPASEAPGTPFSSFSSYPDDTNTLYDISPDAL